MQTTKGQEEREGRGEREDRKRGAPRNEKKETRGGKEKTQDEEKEQRAQRRGEGRRKQRGGGTEVTLTGVLAVTPSSVRNNILSPICRANGAAALTCSSKVKKWELRATWPPLERSCMARLRLAQAKASVTSDLFTSRECQKVAALITREKHGSQIRQQNHQG